MNKHENEQTTMSPWGVVFILFLIAFAWTVYFAARFGQVHFIDLETAWHSAVVQTTLYVLALYSGLRGR